MAQQIIWRKKARIAYEEIIDYLRIEWSPKIASEFIDIVENKLFLLKSFPLIGTKSDKKKDLRKLVLTKHNMLVYTIQNPLRLQL